MILVGNLIAGGTGKTPVTTWLARELSGRYRVAVLSRGYGRRTRGFQVLDDQSNPDSVGDEPMEFRLRVPEILVAVDSNRRRGLQHLESGRYGQIDVVILDDGFQHRRIKPGYSIVLDDFNRPAAKEKLLPAGLRREGLAGLKRADLVIQTKRSTMIDWPGYDGPVVLVTGIGHAGRLADQIREMGSEVHHLEFRDHHRYTTRDAIRISRLIDDLTAKSGTRGILLTTGKDFVKLSGLPQLSGYPIQILPSEPPVEPETKREILYKINQYVEKTIRNS